MRLGQGFDQSETAASRLIQTRRLLHAWWQYHNIVPAQPELELITILDVAAKRTKEVRAKFDSDTQRRDASKRRKSRRANLAAEQVRGYQSFAVGETMVRIARWLQAAGRPAGAREIASTLGLTDVSVRSQLSRMAQRAHRSRIMTGDAGAPDDPPIFRVARGLYRFCPPGEGDEDEGSPEQPIHSPGQTELDPEIDEIFSRLEQG